MNYPGESRAEQLHMPEAIHLSSDLCEWHERIASAITDQARIIALRGAGAVNGIDPEAAHRAVDFLQDSIQATLDGTQKPVILMYEGYDDNRSWPDVGSVYGSVADIFEGDPRVRSLAVQRESQYYPNQVEGSLESARKTPYETYVFPDSTVGLHSALTQSEQLIAYPDYEQLYVGPAEPIALAQLAELSKKATDHTYSRGSDGVSVLVLSSLHNEGLNSVYQEKLRMADSSMARDAILQQIKQRSVQPYGAFINSHGGLAIMDGRYPGIRGQHIIL